MMVMIMTMCSSSHYTIHYQWEWDISTLDSSSSISRINFHEHVTEFSDWLLWRLLKVCVCVCVCIYIHTCRCRCHDAKSTDAVPFHRI